MRWPWTHPPLLQLDRTVEERTAAALAGVDDALDGLRTVLVETRKYIAAEREEPDDRHP